MKLEHPSFYLQPGWVKTIRNASAIAENSGMLHPDQLAIIYEQGWFKLLVPAVYSGREIILPEMVRLEESISWADGSVGWVVTLCSGAGWFGGFLAPQKADSVFNNEQVCLAGSGAATGTATITEGGYTINGVWKYASGAHHATHFTANCIIKQGNETLSNEDGSPLVSAFIFDRKDVELLPAWKYIGMMGTGSDAFKVTDILVPDCNSFKINAGSTVVNNPLYKYPFLQLAEVTLTANISGVAMHFIDLCAIIFREKQHANKYSPDQKTTLNSALEEANNELNDSRKEFYDTVDLSWDIIQKGDNIEVWEEVSYKSRKLAKIARECVDRLYPYCGLQAASPETEINRVWRDIHTASQHSLLTFA